MILASIIIMLQPNHVFSLNFLYRNVFNLENLQYISCSVTLIKESPFEETSSFIFQHHIYLAQFKALIIYLAKFAELFLGQLFDILNILKHLHSISAGQENKYSWSLQRTRQFAIK